MIRNYKGFFSWQGNNLEPSHWFAFLIVGLGFLGLIMLFLFKERLRKHYKNQKKYLFFFKNETVMYRTVGIIGLMFISVRTILMWVFGYNLYWESLNFHLCRFSISLLFLFFAFNKVDWIKYVIYLSVMGFFFAMLFGYEDSEVINKIHSGDYHVNSWKNISDIVVTDHLGKIIKTSNFERLMIADGVTFYHAGWDNWFFYDLYLSHIAILLIPTYIYFTRNQKFTVVELYRLLMLGTLTLVVMWSYNTFSDFIPDPHWRGNFWFIGRDRNNDMSHALGPLSAWPQNIFTYGLIGLLVIVGFNFIWMTSDKYEWFTEGKIVKVKKSQNWIDFKQEHKELGIKNILKQAIWIKKK